MDNRTNYVKGQAQSLPELTAANDFSRSNLLAQEQEPCIYQMADHNGEKDRQHLIQPIITA